VGEARPRHCQVRIVAATNAPLADRVAQGQFRPDLFYRIDVARLALPPLRERKDEIPALASLFVTQYSRECQRSGLRLGDDLIAALLLYDWPGNIRQLANELRRVVAVAADGETLTSADLSADVTRAWNARPVHARTDAGPVVEVRLDQPLGSAIEQLERQFIAHAMDLSGGRVTEAAARLGLSRKGLFLKRRRQGLTGH
jgi:transcriptional regulator with PAS, ATPase and Fis domain